MAPRNLWNGFNNLTWSSFLGNFWNYNGTTVCKIHATPFFLKDTNQQV